MLSEVQELACGGCINRKIDRFYRVLDLSDFNEPDVVREFVHTEIMRDPIAENPELFEDFTCHGCGCVFIENAETDRYDKVLSHADSGVEVWVHRQCAKRCEQCDKTYASARTQLWSGNFRYIGDLRDFVTIQGEEMCNGCTDAWFDRHDGREFWFECENCSEWEHRNNGRWYNDDMYCEPCHDNNVFECDDCGRVYFEDHDCDAYDRDDNYSSYIHSYSYRPQTHFFGQAKYHMGFELEVEARNTSRNEGAELAYTQIGERGYLKEDGSLSDGFEIVTHPHTLNMYQTSFPWEMLDKIKRQGMRSWNTRTCGLHVHVSREAFHVMRGYSLDIVKTQGHELRFMKLIYDNQRMVERIAGRSNNNYANFSDKNRLIAKVKYGTQNNGRYSAINTENDATLEVRVFKGSLRKERVLSALEFVHSSVEYTRNLKVSGSNNALSWLQYTRYVAENQQQYPNLALIMNESFLRDSAPEDNGDE
jgi:hypothetical protein